jgi:hypothetical protein
MACIVYQQQRIFIVFVVDKVSEMVVYLDPGWPSSIQRELPFGNIEMIPLTERLSQAIDLSPPMRNIN